MSHRTLYGFADAFERRMKIGPRFARCFAEDAPESAGAAGGGAPADGKGDEGESEKQKLIAESRKYRKRAQETEERLSRLEGRALSEEELAEYHRLKEQDRRDRQGEADRIRDSEKLAAELAEKHARELASADQRSERLAAQLRKVVGTDRLKSALAARGVTRVDQAAYLLQRHIQVELRDGEPVVRVVDAGGEPIVDRGRGPGETITIERFVDVWLAEEGAHFLPASGDTGSGAHKGGSADRADIAELEADPTKRYAFIREHGTDEYLRRLGEWKRRQAAKK